MEITVKNKSLIFGTTTLALAAGATLASAEVNQPQEIVMRPLTTPGSQITVAGDLGLSFIADQDMGAGLLVGGRYGVDDKIEVGASYGLTLASEFEAKGPFIVEGAYNIMEGNLSVAANATIGYDLEGEAITPLNIGARVRFRVNDQLAVTTGAGGGAFGLVLPGDTPRGGQLTITLDGEVKPIVLSLPVGVAYQVNPQIYAYLNTTIGHIGIADADGVDGFLFADFIPLQVGGMFSPSNTMDFGASIGWFDLDAASDSMFVFGSARLHM